MDKLFKKSKNESKTATTDNKTKSADDEEKDDKGASKSESKKSTTVKDIIADPEKVLEVVEEFSLDFNLYATKKTISQGMLDVALLTANISQLKYILLEGKAVQPFYYFMLVCTILSILMQIAASCLVMLIGNTNINKKKEQKLANLLNDILTLIIFVITLTNIILNVFVIQHARNNFELNTNKTNNTS